MPIGVIAWATTSARPGGRTACTAGGIWYQAHPGAEPLVDPPFGPRKQSSCGRPSPALLPEHAATRWRFTRCYGAAVTALTEGRSEGLGESGLAVLEGPYSTVEEAFDAASSLIAAMPADHGMPPIEISGEFQVPPLDGPPSGDFQTLHFDFGLPIDPVGPGHIARYTALHLPVECPAGGAVTRFIGLDALLGQRPWPDREKLLAGLIAYGGPTAPGGKAKATSRTASPGSSTRPQAASRGCPASGQTRTSAVAMSSPALTLNTRSSRRSAYPSPTRSGTS